MMLRLDALAQYEGDASKLLQSNAGWAAFRVGSSTNPTLGLIVGGGRDGGDSYRSGWATSDAGFDLGIRNALPSGKLEAFIQFAYLTPQYPSANNFQGMLWAFTSGGLAAPVFHVSVGTTGSLQVYNSSNSLLGESDAGVIIPNSKQAIAVHYIVDATNGEIEIRVDKATVLHLTTLNLGSTAIQLLSWNRNITNGSDTFYTEVMDFAINDTTGDYNTTWLGDPKVTFLRARADNDAEQGWTARRRAMFGAGTLDNTGATNSSLSVADASAMRVGSGDFTMEGFFHFTALPGASESAVFFGKWLEAGDLRSWQLFYGGSSVNSNHLDLRVSTSGAAGGVTTPISIPWTPIVGHTYHIAVQASGSLATLYIDGLRQNAPVAWPTPADNSALFMVGGQQSATNTFLLGASFQGYMDEIRFTKGVARYGSGFAVPTSAFGRNTSDDPDYSSVNLLLGFDNAIVDESSAPRTVTARGNVAAVRYVPDDAAPGNYKVVLHGNRDDSYLEAALTAATAFLTLTVNPTTNNTVTLDGVTYTFKSPFVNTANNVLIGATADDSINNLVAAINAGSGAGTLYGTGTTPSSNTSAANRGLGVMEVDANTLGTAGNSIAVASSNGANPWNAATLTGGLNLPDPSSFLLERLPAHTITVLAASILHRSRKTDSGDANVQASLVTADGSSANGTDQALTTNFIFYNTIIEEDPSLVSTGLSPATFVNAKVRVDRTA